jgi:hypothetical protein
MIHSGKFRRGSISSRPAWSQVLYWLVALPGICMGILFVIGLVIASAWFARWVAREQSIDIVREGINRAR